MREKIFNGLTLCVAVILLSFGLAGFSNRKSNLYKNMINASVVIHGDFGWGSGVFIDDNVVLTAAHVLRQISVCDIELIDGTVLKVNDFYIDDKEDIGFIFIDADELCIAKVSAVHSGIGDIVYLVGTPYSVDLKFTITKGILSHLDRDIFGEYDWKNLLQTDAEGAPGSSGSPLYDSEGRMIGICVTGIVPGGGVTLCESSKSILEAYERCKELRNALN